MKSLRHPLLVLLAMSLILSACEKPFLRCIKGEGEVVSQTFDLGTFIGVDLQTAANVYITQDATQEVRVEAPQNLIDNLELRVNNQILEIDDERCVKGDVNVDVYITIPYLSSAHISGSGNVDVSGFDNFDNLSLGISGSGNINGTEEVFNMENFDVEISGSGTITVNVNTTTVDVDKLSGSGTITLSGTTNTQNVAIPGSGNYEAFNLVSGDASVSISGSGNIEITANNSLDVDISGSGNVYYKGMPAITTNISGTGNVIDAN